MKGKLRIFNQIQNAQNYLIFFYVKRVEQKLRIKNVQITQSDEG